MILANPNPIFQPAMRVISAITNAEQAAVTTTFAHQYTTGIIARLHVPPGFGMVQANQLYGPIIVTGDTTFTIDIDTTFMDVFATPATFPQNRQYATVTAIGEVNLDSNAPERNILNFNQVF